MGHGILAVVWLLNFHVELLDMRFSELQLHALSFTGGKATVTTLMTDQLSLKRVEACVGSKYTIVINFVCAAVCYVT